MDSGCVSSSAVARRFWKLYRPSSELSPSAVVNLDDDVTFDRALGLSWNTKDDTVTFTSKVNDAPFTKRGILRMVFDPLGCIAPFVVKELWRQKLDWDEVAGPEEQKFWKKYTLKNQAMIFIHFSYSTSSTEIQENMITKCPSIRGWTTLMSGDNFHKGMEKEMKEMKNGEVLYHDLFLTCFYLLQTILGCDVKYRRVKYQRVNIKVLSYSFRGDITVP